MKIILTRRQPIEINLIEWEIIAKVDRLGPSVTYMTVLMHPDGRAIVNARCDDIEHGIYLTTGDRSYINFPRTPGPATMEEIVWAIRCVDESMANAIKGWKHMSHECIGNLPTEKV